MSSMGAAISTMVKADTRALRADCLPDEDFGPEIEIGSRVKVVGGTYGVGRYGTMKHRLDAGDWRGGYFAMDGGWYPGTVDDGTGVVWYPFYDLERADNVTVTTGEEEEAHVKNVAVT